MLTYTLWSHGRLLGESPLDFVRCLPRLRVGDLSTTPLGLALLARVTDTRSDALFAAQKLHRAEPSPEAGGGVHATPHYATISADLTAAGDYLDALALEVRRPDGSIVPTEQIDVTDTEFLVAFGAVEDEPADSPDEADTEGEEFRVSFDPDTDVDDPDDHEGDEDLFTDPDALGLGLGRWREQPLRAFPRFQLHVTLFDDADLP